MTEREEMCQGVTKAKIRGRVPGLRETFPVKRDVLGKPIQIGGSGKRGLLSPIYHSKAVNDPLIVDAPSQSLSLDTLPEDSGQRRARKA